MVVKIFPDLERRLIPVHERHVAVHKDQVIVAELPQVQLHVLYHFLEGLLSVE